MTREQWLILGMATATVLALVAAATLASMYGSLAFYRAIEVYYREVTRLTEELQRSQAQEQRGAENYRTLEIINDDLQRRFDEQRRTIAAQEALILALRQENTDLRRQQQL